MKDGNRPNFLSATLALLLLAPVLLQISACSSVSYYSQAISGHLSLMHQRQEVEALLDNPQTDPTMAAQLRLSQEILDFAEGQLLLDADGSYRQVVLTGQEAVSWNVVAAGEFSVDAKLWCFPIAGCVPYRGYFKQQQASESARHLQADGYDVYLSPVAAYSTLGWFDDPLLDTMLAYSSSQLAGVLFHELAHQKLYIAGDTNFNESFAQFVESVGVKQWLQQTGQQQELRDWLARRQAEPQFTALLDSTRARLISLYESELDVILLREQKQNMFEELKQHYNQLVAEQWEGRSYFAGWMQGEMNNARLALAESYAGGVCAFAELYQQANEELDEFYALAEQQSRLSEEQRQAWLQTPCNAFASAYDL
jgi:predicted aminopeptidase